MVILVAVLIALVLLGLAALVADTVRFADRIGGTAPLDLTHRAYLA